VTAADTATVAYVVVSLRLLSFGVICFISLWAGLCLWFTLRRRLYLDYIESNGMVIGKRESIWKEAVLI
jgi:hypothetical protein